MAFRRSPIRSIFFIGVLEEIDWTDNNRVVVAVRLGFWAVSGGMLGARQVEEVLQDPIIR